MFAQNNLEALPLPNQVNSIETEPKKTTANRFFNFLKVNWKVLLGLALSLGLVGFLWFNLETLARNASGLKADLMRQRQAQAEEIRQLTDSFERQQSAQAAIDRKFEDRLQALSEQYEEALRGVARARRVRQRQIEEDPSTLPGVFESTFGIRPIANGAPQ